MSSVNKVILIGNVGKDPEVRQSQSGARFANFSLATSERWKDKTTGEQKDNTQWHRVAVFSEPLVNVIEKYVKSGTKVYLEGQLETRKWTDKEGKDQYSTEVVLRPYKSELVLLSEKQKPEVGEGVPSKGGFDTLDRVMDSDIPF